MEQLFLNRALIQTLAVAFKGSREGFLYLCSSQLFAKNFLPRYHRIGRENGENILKKQRVSGILLEGAERSATRREKLRMCRIR